MFDNNKQPSKKSKSSACNVDNPGLTSHKDNAHCKEESVHKISSATSALQQSNFPISKAIEPILDISTRITDLTNNAAFSSARAIAEAINTPFSAESAVGNISNALTSAVSVANYYNDYYSSISKALETASITSELAELQASLINNAQSALSSFSAVTDYIRDFQLQWNNSLSMASVAERSIAAQNLAFIRVIPDYEKMTLPRGSKQVLKSLTKSAAEKLIQTEDIKFDPRDKEFYHKDYPGIPISPDQVTVLESAQDQFADISLDELLSFESQLYEDPTFALDHPVGKKIFKIIQGWNDFVGFGDTVYYHARRIEKHPFIDQEMLKAPQNVSSHGRYNAIGKSCYYIAETKDGAINEILKHSGGSRPIIQVAGLKAVKPAKIIDLSLDTQKSNRFMEHLRFSVDNDEGIIIKEYLLPNFVASCCKKIGIEGIRYKSTGYNCIVLWKDDYFEFVEGSRDIIYAK